VSVTLSASLLTLRAIMSCALALFFFSAGPSFCQTVRSTRVAVPDFGTSSTGSRAASEIRKAFAKRSPDELAVAKFETIDPDLARVAALGGGYKGSLNLTIEEARDLGLAIGCDFYFLGDAETLKRSPSTGASYFESFASVFLVSARTGRLVLWERPNVQSDLPEESERASATELSALIIEVMSDENSETDKDVRAPRAYRRLKPPYPETAARAEAEATVDALVDIDARGEVGRVEIVRWAGYGLDQSVVDTVEQMHFFPAMRNGIATPVRVLLRYNFRKPPIENSTQQKPLSEPNSEPNCAAVFVGAMMSTTYE